jgi:hypothetical protein
MSIAIDAKTSGVTEFRAKNSAAVENCRFTADETRRDVFEATDIVWLRDMEEAMETGQWIALGHE